MLRPVHAASPTAAQRAVRRALDRRIALPGPSDELKELADTFDAMLDRLGAAFEAQRRFVADAVHELRTPLAVMRAEVDVALADPDAERGGAACAATVVRDATMRADRLVDSLLLLARSRAEAVGDWPAERPGRAGRGRRAGAGRRGRRGPRARPAGRDVVRPRQPVLGDRGLLERLAGNLVENAVRHNVNGGWIRVDTGTVEGQARIEVCNAGAVIGRPRCRGCSSRSAGDGSERTGSAGAGLGLSIVRAVADAARRPGPGERPARRRADRDGRPAAQRLAAAPSARRRQTGQRV